MVTPEQVKDAKNLLASKLLPQILQRVEQNTITAWRVSKSVEERKDRKGDGAAMISDLRIESREAPIYKRAAVTATDIDSYRESRQSARAARHQTRHA